MKHLIHRDQVHNDVFFDSLSVALLNTPQMQRLGRVYQLGFAHLVYRGGTHTRLSHVMGVSHMATEIVRNLKNNYQNISTEEIPRTGVIMPKDFLPYSNAYAKEDLINERWQVLELLVRWGALLHDLGHIPLGHTLEDEYSGIFEKHDSFKSPRMNFLWNENELGQMSPIKEVFIKGNLYPDCFHKIGMEPERVWETVLLICLFKSDIQGDNSAFSKIYANALSNVHGSFFHQYMADIVADTICADYLDYLQRDTENVGLDGVKDLRILQSYFIGQDLATGSYRMSLSLLDRSGKSKLSVTTTAKNLVRHRYDLAEIIYYHKTKVEASAMLAKVFSIIDKPNEVRKIPKTIIDIDNIHAYTDKLLNEKNLKLPDFLNSLKPESLLDPIIGDETLLFWLLQETINKLEKVIKSKEKKQLEKYLTAVALLESIIERRLYKNTVTITAELIGKFIGTDEEETIEETIKNLLVKYRNSPTSMEERNKLEDLMQIASGFPYGSFITYIPGRKSQAKGIETGAFDKNGKVITLGKHSSVMDEVELLNRNYKRLWKFLVFTHPKYKNDYIHLSESVDSFLMALFPGIVLRNLSKEIKSACRFPYISKMYRKSVEQIRVLNSGRLNAHDMQVFELAKKSCESTTSADEISYRFKLIELTDFAYVKKKFSEDGSLSKAVNAEKKLLTVSESKKGLFETEDILFCIKRIAEDFKKKDE